MDLTATRRSACSALDPSGTTAEALPGRGDPNLVLLDAKGHVQAATWASSRSEDLLKDIDTVLSGKSLFAPEGEKAAVGGEVKPT